MELIPWRFLYAYDFVTRKLFAHLKQFFAHLGFNL